MKKETDTELSISINDEIMYGNNLIEEIPSHQNSAEVTYYTCDDNGIFYSIQKKRRMSHQFNISMQLMTYL